MSNSDKVVALEKLDKDFDTAKTLSQAVADGFEYMLVGKGPGTKLDYLDWYQNVDPQEENVRLVGFDMKRGGWGDGVTAVLFKSEGLANQFNAATKSVDKTLGVVRISRLGPKVTMRPWINLEPSLPPVIEHADGSKELFIKGKLKDRPEPKIIGESFRDTNLPKGTEGKPWKTGGYVIPSLGLIRPPDEPGLTPLLREDFPPNYDPVHGMKDLVSIEEWKRKGSKCLNGERFDGSVPDGRKKSQQTSPGPSASNKPPKP